MRKTIAGMAVIALFALLAFYATGSRFHGTAEVPADIPLVGEKLTELELAGPAKFRGFEHPHGGGTFTITGTATPDSVARFCNGAKISLSRDGTSIQNREAILNYLQNLDIPLPDSNVKDSDAVLFGFGGRFRKLYGVYNPTTQQLVISLQFDSTK